MPHSTEEDSGRSEITLLRGGLFMITYAMVATATDTWRDSEWRVMPLNVPTLLVDPPAAALLITRESEFEELVGSYHVVQPSHRRAIDSDTHGALLEESLRDYEDIWRILAQR